MKFLAQLTHRSVLFIGLSILLFGCSSSGSVNTFETDSQPTGPTKWSEVEKIDLDAFPEVPVEIDRDVKHDVPEILMKSKADDSVIEQVDGFRVQVFSSVGQYEAIQAEDRVRDWINSLSEQRRTVLGIQTAPVIYSLYKQPYYRVRVGDYLTRARAQTILNALKSTFPGALVVPDVVQVRR
ncbi:MAG: SPOR domain-containing protein [Bacteroidetes bacterium]|nr:SPOR domain-containing protein [Bacteroidota bacterium]